MKLGASYRSQSGLILRLKGVHFYINELRPEQVECVVEQTFYVVGSRNGYLVKHPINITRKSLKDYQEISDTVMELFNRFNSSVEVSIPLQPTQLESTPSTPSPEEPNQGSLF